MLILLYEFRAFLGPLDSNNRRIIIATPRTSGALSFTRNYAIVLQPAYYIVCMCSRISNDLTETRDSPNPKGKAETANGQTLAPLIRLSL